MEVWLLVTFCAAVLLLGFVARLAFDRWKVPDFLWLVFAGLALGPAGGNLLPADVRASFDAAAPPLLAVTAAFLMMEAGIQLTGTGGRATTLVIVAHTAISAALTFVGAWVVCAWVFGLSAASATVLAAATLGPSAVVLASLATRLSVRRETRDALLFEGVLANVLGFFVVMSVPGIGTPSAGLEQWAGALSTLALSLMLAVAVALVWGFALQHLHPKEGVFIATLAVALGVYGLAAGPLLGNGAVAAFTFGVVLRRAGGIATAKPANGAPQSAAADLGRFHSEVSFLVRTFFFVYVGLRFDPSQLTVSAGLLTAALVAVFLAARYPSCLLLDRAFRLPRTDFLILVGSVSRGLTDVLLVLYAVAYGLVPASESALLSGVIVLLLIGSLAVNGITVAGAEAIRRRDARAEAARDAAEAGYRP